MDPICYGNTPYIVSLGLEKDSEWKLILDSHYIDEWNKCASDVQQDDDVFIMKLRMNNATSNRVSEHLKCQQ
jgi:hypothetical protein